VFLSEPLLKMWDKVKVLITRRHFIAGHEDSKCITNFTWDKL